MFAVKKKKWEWLTCLNECRRRWSTAGTTTSPSVSFSSGGLVLLCHSVASSCSWSCRCYLRLTPTARAALPLLPRRCHSSTVWTYCHSGMSLSSHLPSISDCERILFCFFFLLFFLYSLLIAVACDCWWDLGTGLGLFCWWRWSVEGLLGYSSD